MRAWKTLSGVSDASQGACRQNQLTVGQGYPRALPLLGPPAQARTKEDEQHAHTNLQHEGDGDEDHQGDEEGEARALLDDSLQLGGIGQQQCDVQHALCRTLLIGIMVHVDGPVPAPAGCLQGGGWSARALWQGAAGLGPPWCPPL